MQIVRNNFSLKLLAVALALVGWAYFRFANNPSASFDQQLSIPITAVNLPLGYVARFGDHQAVVTIETKHGEHAINPEEIKAVLDLAGRTTGVYNVPVALVAPDLAVQSLSPASVTLRVEPIEQRPFAIAVHYVGAKADGIVVSDAQVSPRSATLRAATSVLAQVSAVHADVALPNQRKDVDVMVRPVAVDASGAEVPEISMTPNLVRVTVHFVAGQGR